METPIPILPSTPTPNKNIYKILFFIFFSLFLTTILLSTYLLLKASIKKQNSKTENKITENIAPTAIITETPIPTIITAETQNWKTYTNPTYNYSIQYPSNWTIDLKITTDTRLLINSPEKIKSIQDPNNYEGYSGDDIDIEIYKDYKKTLTQNQTLEEYLKNNDLFSNIRKIKIGDINSYLVDETGMDTYPAYFFINSNNVFKINSFLNFSQTELKIIDSFKLN